MVAHFDGKSLAFDNICKIASNGQTGNFFKFCCKSHGLQTRKCLENTKIAQNASERSQTVLNQTSEQLPCEFLLIELISENRLIKEKITGEQKLSTALEQKLFRRVDFVRFDSSTKQSEQF